MEASLLIGDSWRRAIAQQYTARPQKHCYLYINDIRYIGDISDTCLFKSEPVCFPVHHLSRYLVVLDFDVAVGKTPALRFSIILRKRRCLGQRNQLFQFHLHLRLSAKICSNSLFSASPCLRGRFFLSPARRSCSTQSPRS